MLPTLVTLAVAIWEPLPWARRRSGPVARVDPLFLVNLVPPEEDECETSGQNHELTCLLAIPHHDGPSSRTMDGVDWLIQLTSSSPLVRRVRQCQVDPTSPLFLFGLGRPERSHWEDSY